VGQPTEVDLAFQVGVQIGRGVGGEQGLHVLPDARVQCGAARIQKSLCRLEFFQLQVAASLRHVRQA